MKMRRFIFAICWILSLTAISFYGGTVSYGIFFALTLIPFISFLYIACVWFRYKVYQEIGARNIVCGQSVPYYFILQNEDQFAFAGIRILFFSDFSYMEELPGEIEFELLPGEKYKYETSFVCKYRGEYEVGIKAVVISDFFRLFRFKSAVKETKKVIVAPKLIKIYELNSISDINVMIQRETVTGTTELDTVTREYLQGDTLKQIHWKATARNQKLMSRGLRGEEKNGAAIFYDTQRYHKDPEIYLPIENRILETVLALVFFLSEKNIPVLTYYSQDDIIQDNVNSVSDFEEFYENINRIIFDKNEDTKCSIRYILQNVSVMDKQVMFFVLHKIDYEILEMTKPLSENGVVTVFYVITEENIEDFRILSDANRKIIAITPQEELEEVL
ncbi:MAG: DUF58 domain-containing protein [Lachnospiraceae bacterium]|nr:DUF58 domain-containing protein [Lachnospiraceae bacterium]